MYRDIKNKALDNEKNVVHMMHQTTTDNKDKQKPTTLIQHTEPD